MQDTNEFVGQRVDQYDIGDQWLGLPPLSTAETLPAPKTKEECGPVVLLGSIPPIAIAKEWTTNRRLRSMHHYERLSAGFTFSTELADVILGDIESLTSNPDFMSILVERINVGSRLLISLFMDVGNPVYDVPVIEIDERIRRGEVNYVEAVRTDDGDQKDPRA